MTVGFGVGIGARVGLGGAVAMAGRKYGVGVIVGVGNDMTLGTTLGGARVGVGVGVGGTVGVMVGATVGVEVGVAVGVSVGACVAVGSGVWVGVGSSVAVGSEVAVGAGVAIVGSGVSVTKICIISGGGDGVGGGEAQAISRSKTISQRDKRRIGASLQEMWLLATGTPSMLAPARRHRGQIPVDASWGLSQWTIPEIPVAKPFHHNPYLAVNCKQDRSEVCQCLRWWQG